jgi:hypothetical protein
MTDGWAKSAKKAASGVRDAAEEINTLGAQKKPIGNVTDAGFGVEKIVSALEQFPECVRYLNTRRSSGAVIDINSEADVQDVLFLMLRPWITDLVPENPTDKTASRYSIKDFISKERESVIEAKYIRDKKHGRDISREMHDDIEMYKNHPHCKHLVFFVYDRDAIIPDVAALKKQIEGVRHYDGKKLTVFCVIKP